MVRCKIFRKNYDVNPKDLEEMINNFLDEHPRFITVQITSVDAFELKGQIIKPFDTIYVFYKTKDEP